MAVATDSYVDVGGRSLHVAVTGHGGPAVVLEAGSGCSSEHWRAVQELASEHPATYSYDRADHGLSDPAGPWTLEGWVADLAAWLAAGQVPGPYVLVGHSLGGHIVRVFAARHPADVAGLVLVDARHERLVPVLPETFLRRANELMPYDVKQAAAADEIVCGLPAGRFPVTVITHGKADWIHEIFGLDATELAEAEQAWQDHQRDLAAMFPSSRFLVAENSGHMIPMEQPELVAAEIQAVITTVSER